MGRGRLPRHAREQLRIVAERADGSRIFASSPWSAQATLGVGFRF